MCAVVKTLRTLCQVQVWLLLRCDYAAWHKHISPSVIPSGYDRVAQWHIENGHFTREQLAMAAVLMIRQVRHAKTPPGCRFGHIHAEIVSTIRVLSGINDFVAILVPMQHSLNQPTTAN